jgi:membrane AbrB-like protein
MLAALLLGLGGGGHARVHPMAYLGAQATLGIAVSATFTPGSLGVLARHWPVVLVSVVAVLLASAASGILLQRWVGLDAPTASLGTLPGGASGMVAMSDDLGADARLVAVMQYARLIIVVVLASLVANVAVRWGGTTRGVSPELVAAAGAGWAGYAVTGVAAAVGCWVGIRSRVPAGAFIGPLVAGVALGALGVPHGLWPPSVLEASYVALGVWVGSRFDQESLRRIRRIGPAVAALAVALVAFSAGLGWGLVVVTGIDPLTAYLATTPGGMDSVLVAALDTGADASLVVAVQLARLLVVVLAGPPLVQWLVRRAADGEARAVGS